MKAFLLTIALMILTNNAKAAEAAASEIDRVRTAICNDTGLPLNLITAEINLSRTLLYSVDNISWMVASEYKRLGYGNISGQALRATLKNNGCRTVYTSDDGSQVIDANLTPSCVAKAIESLK